MHASMNCCFKFKIGHLGDLPKEVPSEVASNEDFLRKAHHVLLEVNFLTVILAFALKQDVGACILYNLFDFCSI